MCGFIAAFTKAHFSDQAAQAALTRMHHRGPDGEGGWWDSGVYMGHKRLSIIDLDERAAQPMHSACGRYIIVYNGEIYNYQSLRKNLINKGRVFRTTSDTEVILSLFAEQGEFMLSQLHGMFAFVIWDKLEQKAFCARDPYGIKPLYAGKTDKGIILASQVKAITATGLISTATDKYGQAGFWLLGSVPEPHTWFRDIQALPAGHCMWVEEGCITRKCCWHDIGAAWRTPEEAPSEDEKIADFVHRALRESISRHLVSDVPVGVFLSGGIDSGAVAGLMVEAGAHDLQGVTLAYDEFSERHEDEAPVAAQIAAHYGIKHHVRKVTQEEFHKDLPRILAAMDQPSIDGVNTWYASKAVAELGLKVVVSGVGGDELFLGYNSFRLLPRMVNTWSRLSKVPGAVICARAAAKWQAQRTGNRRWEYAPDWMQTMAGAWWLKRSTNAPDDLSELMHTDLPHDLLQKFTPDKWVTRMTGPLPDNQVLALAQIESMTYLRNQLLRDSDWASMDHSVELRTPLVDTHLLNRLQPLLSRFSLYPGKILLAQAPQNPLPDVVAKRSKTGFAIPVKQWLVEELGPETTWQKTVAMHAGE